MQPDDIVAMFEGMMTRDGSAFKLNKLEPMNFGGQKGFRFEFSLTRKVDGVELSGVGFGTVANGELYAMLYAAPQLTSARGAYGAQCPAEALSPHRPGTAQRPAGCSAEPSR